MLLGLAGTALAAFYVMQGQSVPFDVGDFWERLRSFFTRLTLKAVSVKSQIEDQVTDSKSETGAYQQALDLIAEFEGFESHAYPDAGGYSIGYGHFIRQGDGLDQYSVISEAQAYELLTADALAAQNCVAQAVKVPLSNSQEAALISFVYNVGCGNFQGSTMLRKINAGDFAGASAEFPRWNKSKGSVVSALVDRRSKEQEVFNS